MDSARRLPAGHVLFDGELVVVDEAGEVDFDAACARLRSPEGPQVQVYVFDLLALDGEDVRARPLGERKAILARVLGRGDPVVILRHNLAPSCGMPIETA